MDVTTMLSSSKQHAAGKAFGCMLKLLSDGAAAVRQQQVTGN